MVPFREKNLKEIEMNQQFASIDIIGVAIFLVICIGVGYYVYVAKQSS